MVSLIHYSALLFLILMRVIHKMVLGSDSSSFISLVRVLFEWTGGGRGVVVYICADGTADGVIGVSEGQNILFLW